MMKKVFLIFTLLIYWLMGFGQVNVDSLLSIWNDVSAPDTTRAQAYHNYIEKSYFLTDPDSAVFLFEELYKYCETHHDEKGMVDALNTSGYNYFRIGDYTKALESYQKGLDLAKAIDYKKGMGLIQLHTGYIYHDNEDILSGLKYYQQSLANFEAIDYQFGIGLVYNEFGNIYNIKKQFDKALEYYLKSIEINNVLGEGDSNAPLYQNIANLYYEKGDYTKAKDYDSKASLIYERAGDKLAIASSLSFMGDILMEEGDINKAMEFLHKGLSISRDIGDAQGIAVSIASIAKIYLLQKKYDRALEVCQENLKLTERLGDIEGQTNSYQCLYEAYKGLGNHKKALENHESMLLLIDSIKIEEEISALEHIEFAKQLLADSLIEVEKDRQIELIHQKEVRKKDRNRNIALAGVLFFLLLSVGLFNRWRYVNKSKAIIQKEKDRSESLLLNILPAAIADELKEKGEAAARDHNMVSILFSDFEGFTETSGKMSAKALIEEINHCFKAFDHFCEAHGVEKIKTIGDAYMAAGGLLESDIHSAKNTVLAALEMQDFISNRWQQQQKLDQRAFQMRLGIHTGPVVAGIVGVKKFQYDIWGDTVNIASRMESHGEIGKVNISQYTYELIKDDADFTFESRGNIQVKGKGELEMWFVEKRERGNVLLAPLNYK